MADRRKTYTDQQKAEALELYETEGPSAVEKQLGIPKNTVAGWAKRTGIRTVRTERTRAAVEAKVIDGRARRQQIVANQMLIHEKLQAQTLSHEWQTILRGEGGREYVTGLDHVPARDAKDMLSALNSSSTIIARLDDNQTDHDDAKSVIGDLVKGLTEDYERRHQ